MQDPPAARIPAWHALFAPLPGDARPQRRPVAPPSVLARPEGAAIAGMEQVVLDLSAGTAGLRVVLVVLDPSGHPVSASDHVVYRAERVDPDRGTVVEYRHESVGGSLEPDGTFRGTRWLGVNLESADGEPLDSTCTPSPPGAADRAGLRRVIAELLRLAGPRDPGAGETSG